MSEAELFTELTNLVESDPFALLGISVSADEKRIAKRYRHIAKHLHPDALSGEATALGLTQEIAAQVIARIVNPSYQKLKHEKTRQETLTMLRLRVRRLARTNKLVPTFPDAQQLETLAEEEVEVFYEQAMSQLAAAQFRSLGDLHTHSLAIGQLNLIYLRRKMADQIIRTKRAGLISMAVTPTAAMSSESSLSGVQSNSPAGVPADDALNDPLSAASQAAQPLETNYAAKHTGRAKTYLAQQNYELAVQELRDALKLSPQSPELHSMIGQAYYKQKLSGMAKAHFRQALKLRPDHKVARKYGKLLGLTDEPSERKYPPDQTGSRSGKASAESSSDKKTAEKNAAKVKEDQAIPTPETKKTPPKRPWLDRLLNL